MTRCCPGQSSSGLQASERNVSAMQRCSPCARRPTHTAAAATTAFTRSQMLVPSTKFLGAVTHRM